jgi:hypothetical protein
VIREKHLGGTAAERITMLSIKNLETGWQGAGFAHFDGSAQGQSRHADWLNGAGKTTTMRAISGMIKPTAGEINLHGKRIDDGIATARRDDDGAWPPCGRRAGDVASDLERDGLLSTSERAPQ